MLSLVNVTQAAVLKLKWFEVHIYIRAGMQTLQVHLFCIKWVSRTFFFQI